MAALFLTGAVLLSVIDLRELGKRKEYRAIIVYSVLLLIALVLATLHVFMPEKFSLIGMMTP